MKREFHSKARTGKTRVWTIEVSGDEVITTFGELDGKMQQVVDKGHLKNAGKVNEISPEKDAQNLADRQVLLKTRQGYRPIGEEPPTEINWKEALPGNLCFYKPDNSLSKTMEKKIAANQAWLGRKRDGEMVPIVKNADGSVDIYSRRMLLSHHLEVGQHTWNDRFPHLVEELENRDDIPPRTILLGDLVTDPESDARWDVASIMKSKTHEANRIQRSTPMFFYCWDIAFMDGMDLLSTLTVGDRFRLLWDIFGKTWDGSSWVLPLDVWEPDEVRKHCAGLVSRDEPVPTGNIEAAGFFAMKMGWEGWVAVDPEGCFGDRGFNFRGKPDRPGRYSGKVKPVWEDDFVALFDPDNIFGHGKRGKWGRGKHRGQVGAVSLFQYNKHGELIYICECGGGIDDAFRAAYSSPNDYPLCIRVLYTDRTYKSQGDKTDALQFPRVDAVRADKGTEECINPRL